MALSDSDDDSDNEEESDDDDSPGALGSYAAAVAAKKKVSLGDFDAFDEADENTTAEKMKAILALRADLKMDEDVAWLAEQQKREEEKKRLENMTLEEKTEASGDMMARIREKHLAKQRAMEQSKLEEEEKARAERAKMALARAQADSSDEESEDSEPKKKKKKKKKKKVD